MFREADLDAYADMCADEEVMRVTGVGGSVGADAAFRQMALFLGEWSPPRSRHVGRPKASCAFVR